MRTIRFNPDVGVMREALTYTTVVGMPGFSHNFDAVSRPYYKFSLNIGPMLRHEVECLSALHAYHQGMRSFFWDGGWYGNMAEYNLAGEGDGARKDFFVPNRYIGHANSIAIRTLRPSTGATSVWITSAFTTWLNPGLVRLTTAPASGDNLQAKYSCYYRVVFASAALQVEQVATDLFTVSVDLMEHPLLGTERPG